MPKTIRKGPLANYFKEPYKYFVAEFPAMAECGTCGTVQEVYLTDLDITKYHPKFSCSECGWDNNLQMIGTWVWEGWEEYRKKHTPAEPEPRKGFFRKFMDWLDDN